MLVRWGLLDTIHNLMELFLLRSMGLERNSDLKHQIILSISHYFVSAWLWRTHIIYMRRWASGEAVAQPSEPVTWLTALRHMPGAFCWVEVWKHHCTHITLNRCLHIRMTSGWTSACISRSGWPLVAAGLIVLHNVFANASMNFWLPLFSKSNCGVVAAEIIIYRCMLANSKIHSEDNYQFWCIDVVIDIILFQLHYMFAHAVMMFCLYFWFRMNRCCSR